jgi:hypothetical protein
LVGYVPSTGTIRNSYALGDVAVDDPYATGSAISAGGLIGYQSSGSATYCFAKGNVNVSAQAGTGKNVNAGGIAGRRGGTIANCVSLCETIIAKGGNNRTAARIMNTVSTASINNRALAEARLWELPGYYDIPGTPITLPTGTDVHDRTNGASVSAAGSSTLSSWTWWNSTAGFTTANGWSSAGIGRGYPKLAWEL